MNPQFGRTLLPGLELVARGAFIWPGGGCLLGWFGHLPGDIRSGRTGRRLYAPMVSRLVVSVLVSVLLRLVRGLGS